MTNAIERYRDLRRETGQSCARLEQMHCRHLACKARCHDCCVNLTVFPVEYHAILEDLTQRGAGVALDESASCAFLRDGLCGIYAVRPMICRTHGLPVAFVNEEEDAPEPEMSVSFCPKNFTDAHDLIFDARSTLDIDALNFELSQINLDFLQEHRELALSPCDRIPLRQLREDLAKALTSGASVP